MIGHSGLFVNLKSQNHGHLHTKVYRSGHGIQEHSFVQTFLLCFGCNCMCYEKEMNALCLHALICICLSLFLFFASFLYVIYHYVTYTACSGWSMGESQSLCVTALPLCFPQIFWFKPARVQTSWCDLMAHNSNLSPFSVEAYFSYVACFFYNIKKMFDLLTV